MPINPQRGFTTAPTRCLLTPDCVAWPQREQQYTLTSSPDNMRSFEAQTDRQARWQKVAGRANPASLSNWTTAQPFGAR